MRLTLLLQLAASAALAGVGFVLASLHRSIVALSPGQVAPPWLWAVWIGYVVTLCIFAYATLERRA